VSAAQASTGYVVNALAVAHALLKATGEMTTMQLHQALIAKKWSLLGLGPLAEALASHPEWFTKVGAETWLVTSEDVGASIRLEGLRLRAHQAAAALDEPVAFVSGGGDVWHADLDCAGLWDGKAEAVAKGYTLREIEAQARRIAAGDRPACSVCVTDVTR
jgi:hypothetical protein